MQRRNILVSAYAFSPYQGSECAVGWNIVIRLAKAYDVTVLCGDLSGTRRMKNDLERYFKLNPPIQGLCVHYVAPGLLIRFFEKMHTFPGLWMSYYLAYNLWQREAFKEACKLHMHRPFDLVHQLNMIGFRESGYLWRLKIPFVWGPVGGSPNEPLAFIGQFSLMGGLRVVVRNMINNFQKRTAWRSRLAAHCASKLWAVTSADVQTMRDLWGMNVEQMLETGVTVRHDLCPRSWGGQEALRIVWSGIHLPRKALPIFLHAVAGLEEKDRIIIDVLGEGPESAGWKALAERLGLNENVTWHGMLPHEKALSVMSDAHLMAFSSLKEGTPHVVLEALSLGLPVICHDACGMGIAVTKKCGIKIPLCDPQTSIEGFSQAIRRIFDDKALVESLSRGALERAAELSWDKKVEEIVAGYEDVVINRQEGK